jgi:hypothetical protein
VWTRVFLLRASPWSVAVLPLRVTSARSALLRLFRGAFRQNAREFPSWGAPSGAGVRFTRMYKLERFEQKNCRPAQQ